MTKFDNFIEEGCTGTGDLITCIGATEGNIPFSEGYSNGDQVPYSLEDSLGVIRVIGIGIYNSGGNTITRNDTWAYNGANIDYAPSSNPVLNAGTHTIRVAVPASRLNSNTARPEDYGATDDLSAIQLCFDSNTVVELTDGATYNGGGGTLTIPAGVTIVSTLAAYPSKFFVNRCFTLRW